MISASKNTLSLNNLKNLRSKGMKNLTNFGKKFCESPPDTQSIKNNQGSELFEPGKGVLTVETNRTLSNIFILRNILK